MKGVRAAVTLLALAALGAAVPSERIVGGSYTEVGEYPEVVSVYRNPLVGSTRHLCGGIIVNDNHVLTTAICVQDENSLYLHVIAATVDLSDITEFAEVKNVNDILIHEDFDSVTRVNNLAILRTSHNFVFVTGLVLPAVLPPTGTQEPATGTVLAAVGWGQNGPDGEMETLQKAVNMTYYTQEECTAVYGMFVQPNEGCLMGGEQTGVCVGDEGGLTRAADGTAIGLLSWHFNCDDYPAVVNLLAPYNEWIVSHFDT